ncbi:hypothetical protein SAMN04487820_10186 [Actinopolyspora mzabensis]|uniref:Uncharacterized protein n=1 Tax=Actinopolyspora mzabensis TaxID=995066 RepID=A0A1G8VH98_ACTMZ|nr:DUF5336 domain-containing protein [Actinopolyspora mzabensis]SDJ65418.1 hypothetical protein SAMN04487820_10186 [Actinopolyspora mzabensis]
MSAPYPPSQHPAPPGGAGGSQLDAKSVLALAAAGIGALGWILGFFAPAMNSMLGGLPGLGFMLVAVLAAMRFLPKAPNTLFVAAPLAVYTALSMLQNAIVSGVWSSGSTLNGWGIVFMLLTLLQAAAVIALLLLEQEIVTAPALGRGAKQAATQQVQPPYPGQQPGPYGTGHPQPGQPQHGQPHPGQPQAGGWNPQSGPQPSYPAQPYTGPQPQQGQPPQGQPQPGQSQPGQSQPGWNSQQAGGFVPGQQPQQPAQPYSPPQAGPAPQENPAQPGAFAPNNPYEQPSQPGPEHSGQAQQEQQSDTNGGPQGTQQMPHPNQNPPA